ncbi:MAG: hypothetical protein KJ042_09160 [Deltaproteobacteria bacterium]|nr:hypothetical protein [Deltaproteobacteria bacterium]
MDAAKRNFTRTATLRYGVRSGDAVHREIEIGPLTADAEMRALLEQPGEIDGDLIFRYSVSRLSEAKRAELKVENTSPPEGADLSRARAMWSAREIHQVRYRIVRLGLIAAAEIPAAAAGLLSEDLATVLSLAREVDAAVEAFRDDDAADVDTGDRSGPGGNPDSRLDFETSASDL